MNLDLFASLDKESYLENISADAMILRGFALPMVTTLLNDLKQIISIAPFRFMTTPNGFKMSVAMSNCGLYGWISDKNGYRYSVMDPITGQKWPEMPQSFLDLAKSAANKSGFFDFRPDACLINKYQPHSKLSLHQDKDEENLDAPIVSVSLGIPAVFMFGGATRKDKVQKFLLEHGDVVVWGGLSRLHYHGIMPLKEAYHPIFKCFRINLTFRQART